MAALLEQLCTPGAGLAALLGFVGGIVYDRTSTRLGKDQA